MIVIQFTGLGNQGSRVNISLTDESQLEVQIESYISLCKYTGGMMLGFVFYIS